MSRSGDEPTYSIGAVARMLGVPASTLRAWEERYALITPIRSEGSQRLYSRAEVEKLRFIKAQIESGVSAADAHRVLSQELSGGGLPAAVPERGSAGGGRPVVLIAERDPYAAELAEYFLRTEGWEVAIALDGEQAQLKFEEQSPSVVIIDLLLSGGAGFHLLTKFAAKHSAQILAVSAIDSAEEAIRCGAAAFMHKPLEPLALVSIVRDLSRTTALARSDQQSFAER